MKRKAIYGKTTDGKPLNTQWEFLLDWLRRKPGRTITSREAFEKFGFTRLSARVFEIEEYTGIILKREDIAVKTRYGTKVWVTKYWYEE